MTKTVIGQRCPAESDPVVGDSHGHGSASERFANGAAIASHASEFAWHGWPNAEGAGSLRYRTLLAKYELLKREIDRERVLEGERLVNMVVERLRAVIEEFGLDIDVVRHGMPASVGERTMRRKHRRKPKYRNPETGQTWSGTGRPPRWMLGDDREQYRIRDDLGEYAESMPKGLTRSDV
ncbi:H-NS histone family protein [Paraburkholderia unamae]|uniref:H-NS histone family protein n=1 Tax=Paraburkholderia unamae TaxID=219649 RepID=UPI001402E3E5|nr:H-NS histone family protein [Paraburkholderia unamae]